MEEQTFRFGFTLNGYIDVRAPNEDLARDRAENILADLRDVHTEDFELDLANDELDVSQEIDESLCIKCQQAEPKVHQRFCQPCWEKVKAEYREAWKDAPPMTEEEFEALVLSFFVGEPDEEGETDDQ